ncbi:hypothetical protein COL26b_009200 [Colletotrichum chrysophilum]|uniref:C2H2-type domain-containing protein n=1 Tax=Colletotrichum chrysophilum TaxID=1836956 RepID=A0AAD9A2I3_9PEZI|nr:uncharacterized protein COL26b_009200 [Colletotrichum chrysophilum]KAJ0372276.1 hypothetical protein COL26b_009200 [Colletotrichum chrysophilum]KAK1840246.1 hypothetical protein CCHR01_17122 [Colletotrichum chrysophilum]
MSALHLAIKDALLRIEQESSEDWFTIDSLTRAVLAEIRQDCVPRSTNPQEEPADEGSSSSSQSDSSDDDQDESEGDKQAHDNGISHANNDSNHHEGNKGRRNSSRVYACKFRHCPRVYQHKSSRTRHYAINHGEVAAPPDTDEE